MIELYRFVVAGLVFGYTTSPSKVTHDGQDYDPIYVRRNEIEHTEEIARARISVRLPRDAGVAALFVGGAPATVMELDIFQQDDEATVVIWTGRVLTAAWSGSEVVLQCEPIFSSMKRTGLHARYQKLCRHALYDDNCKVVRNDFRVLATLTARTDLTLSAAEFDTKEDGWFIAGYVEYGNQRRAIVDHAGDTITLSSPLIDSEVGEDVAAFAGCAHDRQTCIDKFDNVVNYGGMPFIPRINPFGSDPVF
ncbi:MAG: phage BR0599 family protein [Gammaproteobacteria bacterium]